MSDPRHGPTCTCRHCLSYQRPLLPPTPAPPEGRPCPGIAADDFALVDLARGEGEAHCPNCGGQPATPRLTVNERMFVEFRRAFRNSGEEEERFTKRWLAILDAHFPPDAEGERRG